MEDDSQEPDMERSERRLERDADELEERIEQLAEHVDDAKQRLERRQDDADITDVTAGEWENRARTDEDPSGANRPEGD